MDRTLKRCRLICHSQVFIPLLLLAIFNSFLIRSVHLSRKERNDMTNCQSQASPYTTTKTTTTTTTKNGAKDKSSSQKFDPNSSKQENKITVMLIAVVILFFLCQLPTAVMLVYSSLRTIEENTKEYFIIRSMK